MSQDHASRVRDSGDPLPLGPGHKKQIGKFNKAKQRTDQVLEFIEENIHLYGRDKQCRLRKEYSKMKNCANYLKFRYYYEIEEIRLLHVIHCDNKWLDMFCGLRWADKAVQKYRERFSEIRKQHGEMKYIHMTLTVLPEDGLTKTYNKLDTALKNMSQRIRNARRRKNDTSEFRHIRGMIGTIEVKRGQGDGEWHPHFHGLILADEYINQKLLSKEWYDITGDSYIVDVRRISANIKDFCEAIAYTLKSSTMSIEDQIHAYFTLRKKAMLRSWGLFRGVEIPDDLNDQEIENEKYVDVIYRYVTGEYRVETVRYDYERKEIDEYEKPEFPGHRFHEKWQGET